MGDANWWLPGWLDRILPHVDVEGSAVLDDELRELPSAAPADDTHADDEKVLVRS